LVGRDRYPTASPVPVRSSRRSLRPAWHLIPLAALLLLVAFGSPVRAEQLPDSEVSELGLDELLRVKVLKVYGVSRYEQDAREAAAQVTVVDAEDIRRHDYRQLSDLLKSVVGLYVTDDRNYRYLGYRGFSLPSDYNTRMLIMVDGVRLNDEVYHQAPIGFDFPLDLRLVQRVEIIRGPSQALYGNNAFLLVINVITRSPAGTRQAEAELASDTLASLSARGTVSGPVSSSGAGLLLSGSLFETPGSDLYLQAFDTPATNNGIAHGDDFARGGNAFLKYQRPGFSLVGGYSQNVKGIPTGSWGTTFNDSTTRTKDQRFFSDVAWQPLEGPTGSLRLHSYLNAYHYDGTYAYSSGVTYDNSRSATLGAELAGNLVLPGRHILAGGLSYRRGFQVEQGDSSGHQDSHTTDEFGIFVQDEHRPLPSLILTGSLRYDHLAGDLNTLSPKAGVVWLAAPELALKYLFGRSFRAPNVYERFYAAAPYLANPGLSEEVMYSNEIVADYQANEALHLAVTGFQYDYHGLITSYLDDQGFFRFRNAGRLRTRGVEGELSANWENWSGGLGYTFQDTVQLAEAGGPVTNSPHHLAKMRLSREMLRRNLILSGELQYTSRVATLVPGEDAASNLVGNLTLLMKNLLAKGLDLSLSVRNLLDRANTQPGGTEHLPVSRIPQEGISAGARISYRY
jgi:outer membrane receptor for ferrienterochelin and colicins